MATTTNGKKAISNESVNGNECQSYVTAWGTDPERYWELPEYARQKAAVMLSQIFGSLKNAHGTQWPSVLASWGCVGTDGKIVGTVLRWREMPALALHVNGYRHKGCVIISLDEGSDTYELELTDEQFQAKPGSRVQEVYFDELGTRIDAMVETGDDLEAYEQMVASDPDNQEVLSWRKRFPNLRRVVVL